MMSKTRALVYSLGAPLLYLLTQTIATMAVVFYLFSSVFNDLLTMSQDEMYDAVEKIFEDSLALMLPIMLASCILFVVILILSHIKKPVSLWNAVGLTRSVSVVTLVLAALAGFSFNVACQGFIEVLYVPQSWMEANNAVSNTLVDENNMLLTVLVMCFIIPFVEEIAFRGFAQRILHHAFLPWMAVVIQGIIFGAFHANALQTIYAFATGVIIGYIYMKTRNLWAGICFHMAYNGANFILIGISKLFGENTEIGMIPFAIMTAGGATLTLLLVRSIKSNKSQKEME